MNGFTPSCFFCKVQTDHTRTRTLVKQHGLHRQTVMLVLVGQLGVVRRLHIPFEIRVSAIPETAAETSSVHSRQNAVPPMHSAAASPAQTIFFAEKRRTCLLSRSGRLSSALRTLRSNSSVIFGEIIMVHHAKHAPFKSLRKCSLAARRRSLDRVFRYAEHSGNLTGLEAL